MPGIWTSTLFSLAINDLYLSNNKVYIRFYHSFVHKDGQSLNPIRFTNRIFYPEGTHALNVLLKGIKFNSS